MKLVTFKYNNVSDRLGLLKNNYVYDLNIVSNGEIPSNIIEFLNNHDKLKRFLNSLPKAASDLQRFRVACNFIKKGISPKRVRKLLTESRKLSEKNEKRWPNKNRRFL